MKNITRYIRLIFITNYINYATLVTLPSVKIEKKEVNPRKINFDSLA